VKKILITIVGPTAVGKTKVSIEVAQHFKTEIISADARQFYREMNIGTAKPSAHDQQIVPHYFINHLSVTEEYSAGDFEKDAIQKLETLFNSHDVVVMTGGSGLFIKAVLQGLDSFPEVNESVEEDLQRVFDGEGIAALQKLLKEHDEVYYKKVDLNNPQRLLRALAVCISSGKPYSSFRKTPSKKRNFIPVKIGLQLDRKILYQQIDERVDGMMKEGLLEEVKSLEAFSNVNALQTVGYNELFDYLTGINSLEDAVKLIKQHTRNYAKRQMTWFRNEKDITWFQPEQVKEIIEFCETQIEILQQHT
jgi:tRNA dimethylallyltransferase